MSVRGLRPSTQQCYADAIYGLAKHYRGDPAQYTAQEIDAYLLHLVQERHLSYSSMNQAASAARFLYEKVLGHERAVFHIPMAKAPAKQPELLAREEIAHLFAACWRPTHRMLLQTVYATGLPLGLSSRASSRCSTVMNSWRCWRASTKAMCKLTSSSWAIIDFPFGLLG